MRNEDTSIYDSIDKTFCIHAKKVTKYLIEKLYKHMRHNPQIIEAEYYLPEFRFDFPEEAHIA